jgi:hypothetical protein
VSYAPTSHPTCRDHVAGLLSRFLGQPFHRTADTLHEAVADFKQDPTIPNQAGAMTEFTVAVHRPPVEHKIRLGQVAKWAEPTAREGPPGIVNRGAG